MDRNEFIEKYLGGIFAVIAVLAAIVEMILNGIDAASISGAIKDIFGTLVVVVLWISLIINRPKKPKNIDGLLEDAVEKWGFNNAPLIFKAEGFRTPQNTKYTQGFLLLQNLEKYASLVGITPEDEEWHNYAKVRDGGNRPTGKFISMPTYLEMTNGDFKVAFTMGQKHFTDMENLNDIIDSIISAIKSNKAEYAKSVKLVERSGNEFALSFGAIQTKNDIDNFVNSIDFVLSLVKVVA